MQDSDMLEWAARWNYTGLFIGEELGNKSRIRHGRAQWEQFIATATPEEKEAARKRINRWNERTQAA